MLPSKPSDKTWQVVGRGTQKTLAPSQTASKGRASLNTHPFAPVASSSSRNLPKARPILQAGPSGRVPTNTQLPSQTAQKGNGPPRTQPVLNQAPNGRIPPHTSAHPIPAPKQKEKIPYEIKNAREWDPKRRPQIDSSSESSDDEDYYTSDYVEAPQALEGVSSSMADRFQPVINKRFQSKPRRSRSKGPQRAQPRVNLNYKRDNSARAAFRKRLPHTGSFTLPKDCPDIEPNQKKMYDAFDEMGVRLRSFIRPPQHVKDRELLLWGNANQVQATKAELVRWLENRSRIDLPRKAMARDNFARETSVLGVQYHRLTKKMQKEAQILEFQQVPIQDRVFQYTGTFIWPIDEVKPEAILGSSLEAFDPIRFQYRCHILFDSKGSFFKIFSDKEESVKETMKRIVGTMCEYVAKNVRREVMILIEPPSLSGVRKGVKLLPVSLNDPKADKSMIPVLTGSTLDAKARNEWMNESNVLKKENNRRMEISLRKCIANLPHYRGLVRMRVLFGTFALRVYRWKEGADSTPLGEFVKNTTMSETKGVMIRDLQIKKDATTIMAKLQKASDLFLPMDSFSTSLEEVVPSFSACFEFRNLEGPPMNFMLEMSSSSAASTIYEKVQELWTRMDRRDNAVPLEAFIVGLDSGASWKLQVSTENSIDSSRVNPEMTKFAESVRLSKIPGTRTELTGQRVFTWEKDLRGVMQPSAFQQKTSLKYRLAHQIEWEFEIARYDSYGNTENENVPVETNWGATLYNTNWDSTLTANSTLGIGEAARWDPKLETFFPSRPGITHVKEEDPGVTEFFKTVETVTKFIDSIKKELPHLRV